MSPINHNDTHQSGIQQLNTLVNQLEQEVKDKAPSCQTSTIPSKIMPKAFKIMPAEAEHSYAQPPIQINKPSDIKPVATYVPIRSQSLTTHERLKRQKLVEKRVLNSDYNGNPGYDTHLKYKLRQAMDTFKIVSYNHRTKRYKIRHQLSQNQFLYVPAQYLTSEMNPSPESYTYSIEQNFLKEKFRSLQLERKIMNLQKELHYYRRTNNSANQSG